MLYRVRAVIVGTIVVVGLLVSGALSPGTANATRHETIPLTGSLRVYSVPAASPEGSSDAAAVCDDGGHVQFTPDGTQPFRDATACRAYAAEHGGATSLIRRVSVQLSDYGSAPTPFASFTVTGLVPHRQYIARIRVQRQAADPTSLMFLSDEQGNFRGRIVTSADVGCTGGTKLFVDVTTIAGYLLGTTGTYLPC